MLTERVERGQKKGNFLILEGDNQRKSWLLGTGARLPDLCHPVFPVKTLQYCISQRILQPPASSQNIHQLVSLCSGRAHDSKSKPGIL